MSSTKIPSNKFVVYLASANLIHIINVEFLCTEFLSLKSYIETTYPNSTLLKIINYFSKEIFKENNHGGEIHLYRVIPAVLEATDSFEEYQDLLYKVLKTIDCSMDIQDSIPLDIAVQTCVDSQNLDLNNRGLTEGETLKHIIDESLQNNKALSKILMINHNPNMETIHNLVKKIPA